MRAVEEGQRGVGGQRFADVCAVGRRVREGRAGGLVERLRRAEGSVIEEER